MRTMTMATVLAATFAAAPAVHAAPAKKKTPKTKVGPRCLQLALEPATPGDPLNVSGTIAGDATVQAWNEQDDNTQFSSGIYQSATLSVTAVATSVGRPIHVEASATGLNCLAIGMVIRS